MGELPRFELDKPVTRLVEIEREFSLLYEYRSCFRIMRFTESTRNSARIYSDPVFNSIPTEALGRSIHRGPRQKSPMEVHFLMVRS